MKYRLGKWNNIKTVYGLFYRLLTFILIQEGDFSFPGYYYLPYLYIPGCSHPAKINSRKQSNAINFI